MALFKFASIAHPAKYGYAFDTSADWLRANETNNYYRQFETYGDGLIQHSNDWPVTFEYLTDYLASLAVAMLSSDELVEAAGYTFRKAPADDLLTFAASVVYKESDKSYDKRRFFSVELRKIAGRTKEHDKRFTELRDWHDGSRASIYRLACSEYAGKFECYQVAEAVNTWANNLVKPIKTGENYPQFFGGDWRKNHDLQDALQSCRYIAEAGERLRWAKQHIENYKTGLERAARELSESAESSAA